MRELGLRATSSGAIRSVRARADVLGIDYSHFGRLRWWSDDDVRAAVDGVTSWAEAAARLGVRDDPSALGAVRRDARRLGVGVLRVDSVGAAPGDGATFAPHALARAGSMLAASWFTLRGHEVSWPLEPCRYDLVVNTGVELIRVQVKTTISRSANSWKVYLSTSRQGRTTYEEDEIDQFFIIDGDLTCYRIPLAAVKGLSAVHLSAYGRFRVEGFGNPRRTNEPSDR
ncbi:hypothetical protein TPB0596_22270 [Tsukamurella pulmonis]|nr:hypothetical protein TPB0596_22270 [Tsukamurella pulmonis]